MRIFPGSDTVGREIPVHYSIDGKAGDRFDPQFFGNIFPVGYYGCQTDAQFLSNLLIDIAFTDQY